MATAIIQQQEGPARPTVLPRALVFVTLAFCALYGFFVYPGHTFLESDSQIFMPVLLHREDPALFNHDLLVQRPHTAYTIWDEVDLGAAHLTGVRLETALFAMQIALRFLGLLGVLWMLEGFGLEPALALAGAAIYGLGSWVIGPSVMTVEYEPVPRAFALPLVLLGLGLVARGKPIDAAIAGGTAFLLHAPTSLAFWTAYGLLAVAGSERSRYRRGLLVLPAAAVVLKFFAWMEPVGGEAQKFFGRVDPVWEKLQRLRASYVFVSDWPKPALAIYACLMLLIAFAFVRLRLRIEPRLRLFLVLMAAIGLLSMPASWVLMEKLKWSLMPQIQPMRYVLYLVLFGILFCFTIQRTLWVAAALVVGLEPRNLFWLTPLLVVPSAEHAEHAERWRWGAAAVVAVALVVAKPCGFVAWTWENEKIVAVCFSLALLVALLKRWPKAAPAVVLVIFLVVPKVGREASRNLRTPELLQLSDWARANTPKETVFLFADAGRSNEAGVFRYYGRRNVYVDWKVGGQVNYLRGFGELWWARWQSTLAKPFDPARIPEYRAMGIDYLVLKKPAVSGSAVFRNSRYCVVPTSGAGVLLK